MIVTVTAVFMLVQELNGRREYCIVRCSGYPQIPMLVVAPRSSYRAVTQHRHSLRSVTLVPVISVHRLPDQVENTA